MEIYYERKQCIFCNSINIKKYFDNNFTIPLGCSATEINNLNKYMPFNILKCNNCKTYQTQYLGDLNIVYNYNAKPYGNIRNKMYDLFVDFILDNNNINKILEIGGGSGALCDMIINKKYIDYTIVDPSYSGENLKINIINDFFENIDDNDNLFNCDTIIMSHVFEHFYEPLKIIEKIYKNNKIKYIYINHPELENFIKDDTYLVLNPEHTFYIENQFLEKLFLKYGFKLCRKYNHMNFAIFFEFERISYNINNDIILYNYNSDNDINIFFENIHNRVNKINNIIENLSKDIYIYIWPCSMHTTYLLTFGLNKDLLKGVLDNSKDKIGKYLYGTNLLCLSFEETINKNNKIAIILNGGVYNQEININKDNIIIIS